MPRKVFDATRRDFSPSVPGSLRSRCRGAHPFAPPNRRKALIPSTSARAANCSWMIPHRILGGATLTLHKPQARDVVFVCDKPWEGNTSAYFTILQDADKFACITAAGTSTRRSRS